MSDPTCGTPLFNVGCFASNFGSFIKNFTTGVLYGITSNGNTFNLMPTTMNVISAGVFVETHVIQDVSGRIDTLVNKMYQPPIQNAPTFIEEHNILLFVSAAERDNAIKMYGSGEKLVKAYAVGMVSTLNASFKAITCLNSDREFFTLSNGGILKVPSADQAYCEECLRKYHIDKDVLDVEDIFIINTVMKNVDGDGRREHNSSTSIKRIKRSDLIHGQPIIFEQDGLFIFDGRDQAEKFVRKHGNAANYMVNQALAATHQIHDEELADVNEQAQKDKRGMVETFGLMGATSVASILTENVIKAYNSEDEEAIKRSFKLLIVGVIGIGTVIGLYQLYRHFDRKESERKRQEARELLYEE